LEQNTPRIDRIDVLATAVFKAQAQNLLTLYLAFNVKPTIKFDPTPQN